MSSLHDNSSNFNLFVISFAQTIYFDEAII